MAKNIDFYEAQIREIYARVVWTHKTYEKCYDIYHKRNNCLKISEIIISSLTTSGILVSIFGDIAIIGIFSALLAFSLVLIKTLTKNYDLGEVSEKFSLAANNLLNLRESYLSLLVDIKANNLSLLQIKEKRDALQQELNEIYRKSPKTFPKAYKDSSNALKKNEEFTFSNNEIDLLLPKELRKIDEK